MIHYVTDPDILYGFEKSWTIAGLDMDQTKTVCQAMDLLDIDGVVHNYDKENHERLAVLSKVSEICILGQYADSFATAWLLSQTHTVHMVPEYKHFNPFCFGNVDLIIEYILQHQEVKNG